MKLSIVVPAYNEEALLGRCLECVYQALRDNNLGATDTEVIVVDNNSSDSTAEVARQRGARVVFEPVNQISRARNAGGRVASGGWLLFIDADSELSSGLLNAVLERMASPATGGGGALLAFDRMTWLGWCMCQLHYLFAPLVKVGAGPCLFIRAEGFKAIGGFREDLYATEEVHFSRAAGKWARRNGMRFVIIRKPKIITSGRRFKINSACELFAAMLGVLFNARSQKRAALWYDGKR